MNRRQRRAEKARVHAAAQRHAAVRQALNMLRSSPADVTGATVMTPCGEVLHISADTARAMGAGSSKSGGRPC